MTTGAWKGSSELKAGFINRLEEHRRLEHLTQGIGFEKNGETKGCNIGCLFDYYDHARGAAESGLPEILLHFTDAIFEGLSKKEANIFAISWPKAIEPGVNLESIKWNFCKFIMHENIKRVLLLNIHDKLKEQVISAIRNILNLHEKAATTGKLDQSTKSAARSAAWSAAWSAAESARVAVSSAAWSAAWSAESAAWSAASAGESVAWCVESAANAGLAARNAEYKKYAKEFIRLLKEAK